MNQLKDYLDGPDNPPEGRGIAIFIGIVIGVIITLIGLGIWKLIELIELLPK